MTAPTATKAPAATAGMTAAPGAATAPAAATGAAAAATSAPATGGTMAAGSPAATGATGAMTGKVKSQIDTTNIKKGGTLIEAGISDVRTFNPVLQGDTTSGLLNGLIYNALLDVDPDTLQPVPNLATKYDVSPDGKTYTFTLKPNVKWHDGSPFTADDVKFSYDAYMNPDTGTQRAGTLNQRIATVDVKDPMTVVFTLKDVIAPFLVDNMYGIISKKVFGNVPPKEFRTNAASTTNACRYGAVQDQELQAGR